MSASLRSAVIAAIALAVVALAIVRERGLERAPLPRITIAGEPRVELCLSCHAATRGLGPAHDVAVLGCSPCHLGDPSAPDAERAHRGVELLSGDLASITRTCGRRGCHADQASRVSTSLMAGAPGILAVNRFAFGERATPDVRPEDDLRTLDPRTPAKSPAEDHVRKLCGSCHLGARKEGPGDLGFAARGGGCAACHLAPPSDAHVPASGTAARATASGTAASATSASATSASATSASVTRAGPAIVHPDLTSLVPEARCTGCHARSGRISLSYHGRFEVADDDDRARETLPDGRRVGLASPDVHADRGLGCIDCHTERDVMGDGERHAHAADAVDVACTDCHGDGRTIPVATASITAGAGDTRAAVAARLRAAWLARGRPALPSTPPFVTAHGTPLWRTSATERVLARASDGARVAVPEAARAPYHAMRGHERLTCQACHTVWAPRCTECHTTFDPNDHAVDHPSGELRAGAWREAPADFDVGLPALALDAHGRITPFVEGMTITIDGLPSPIRRELWAPLDPHTTGPSRACASCHAPVLVDRLVPATGETTRTGARLLDAESRTRLTRVAACLPCHAKWEDPIWRDLDTSHTRMKPPCRTR